MSTGIVPAHAHERADDHAARSRGTITITITGHGLADAKTVPRGQRSFSYSCSVVVVVVVSVHALVRVRGGAPTRKSGQELQGLASQAQISTMASA